MAVQSDGAGLSGAFQRFGPFGLRLATTPQGPERNCPIILPQVSSGGPEGRGADGPPLSSASSVIVDHLEAFFRPCMLAAHIRIGGGLQHEVLAGGLGAEVGTGVGVGFLVFMA